MNTYFAVIFVGFPGIGKTTIGHALSRRVPNMVRIEQDSYYDGKKSDPDAYLNTIDRIIKSHNVVLCKNHHTHKSLKEVIDVLERNHARYRIFNFVPEDFDNDDFLENLLDRIIARGEKNESHLKIIDDHSRERAKQIILHGFIRKYEEPDEPFIRLNYLHSVQRNVNAIVDSGKFIPLKH